MDIIPQLSTMYADVVTIFCQNDVTTVMELAIQRTTMKYLQELFN